MPLSKEDVKVRTEKGPVCEFCVNSEGEVKSCKEVFEGGVQFFMNSIEGVGREMAEKVTRKNMRMQPQWQGSEDECLKGDAATDEEFADVLKKLHSEEYGSKV